MKRITFATGATFAMVWLAISLDADAPDSALTKVMSLLRDAMFAGIPVAVGIAVLKYRLYDVDGIINRSIVYGPLTAALVALYFGGVLLQRVFIILTGERSILAVVASTLVIAALFNPNPLRWLI